MRLLPVMFMTTLVACGGSSEPAPEPKPEPAPKEEPEPEPEPEAPEIDLGSMNDEEKKAALMKLGEEVYKTGGSGGVACLTCHMENGEGAPGAFPPLKGTLEFMGDCKQHAGYVINGLMGEIEVNGETYNGAMPAQANLSDLEIAAVLTYERNSWGNEGSICLPEQIAEARAAGK